MGKMEEPAISRLIEGAIISEDVGRVVIEFSQYNDRGAVNIFLGQIRADKIEGKEVEYIEYSGYAEMAEKLLLEIIKEYQNKGFEVRILQSLGKVKVGQISLLVAVATSHRADSYIINREIVERIKKDIPLFGKEYFKNSEYKWKVNK